MLTVGRLKEILRMLDEGEPRMNDDTPVRVDFLNDADVVMGPLCGANVETAFWSIDERTVSFVVRTANKIEL